MATEKEIRFLWKQHGGSQHGPRVETYTIPETGFWKFIAALTSTPATSQDVAAIVSAVAGRFASFGGGKTNEFNPLSVMLSERPALFAMGVDVEDVVRFVLEAENAELRRALTMPDADRRHWFLCDLIARVGHFNRADLCTAFGISVPQASHDIKRFLSEFPHVATYNKSAKRYERKDLP